MDFENFQNYCKLCFSLTLIHGKKNNIHVHEKEQILSFVSITINIYVASSLNDKQQISRSDLRKIEKKYVYYAFICACNGKPVYFVI